MKGVQIIVKLVLFIFFIGVAVWVFALGFLLSPSTGIMGKTNSLNERLIGFVYIGVGIAVTFFAFSVFKKNGNDNQIRSTNKKFNKSLRVIPAVILSLAFGYFYFGANWVERAQKAKNQKTEIKNLGYQLFAAKYIPTGYKLKETRLGTIRGDYYYAEYRNSEQEYFMLAQFEKPINMILRTPRCSISGKSFEIVDISGTTSSINSPCQMITTAKGLEIFLMTYEITDKDKYAATLIDKTLVTVTDYKFSQEELIKLFDSLETGKLEIFAQ